LVFAGEGPGADEDRQGLPFVGAAGQLLTKIIQAIGLTREEVYICNVVKCRPPGNRTPTAEEQATCGPFLDRQLDIIAPEVIVALGKTAANDLLGLEEVPLGRLRGRFHPRGEAVVMPTYHPAYLLRNPSAKRAVWEDMKKVRDRLGLKR
jgi:DNA polymerase